jgi:putative transposase
MNKWLKLCCKLYNEFLEERIIEYKQNGNRITQRQQQDSLPFKKETYQEYKEVYARTLQEVTIRLDKSFKNFFRRVKEKKEKPGFPRFKNENNYNSFIYSQLGFKLKNNHLWLSKIGDIKINLNRPIEGEIKELRIKRKISGWYVSIVCDTGQIKQNIKNNYAIGLDLGIKHFLITSNGEFINNPKIYKNTQEKFSLEQHILKRKQRGSNRYNKQKIKLAKIHEKIENQRKDFHHKLSKQIADNYEIIVIEKLDIKSMINKTKIHNINKATYDVGWYQFIQFLNYKVENTGGKLIEVDPKNTSQECSKCGKYVNKQLEERIHKCPYCNLILDRDINAAINILNKGLKQIS